MVARYSNIPVVEVGAVAQVLASQLAGFPDVGQTGDQGFLHGAVLTHLVKLLPRLSSPVGADLLTHIPVGDETELL